MGERGKRILAVVAMVLGFLITEEISLNSRLAMVASVRQGEILSQLATRALQQNSALRNQIKSDRSRLAALEATPRVRDLGGALAKRAGLAPVQGPGVVVTMSDARHKAFPGEPADDLLIHDQYVLHVVALLFSVGARAIAIDGQRYVATTAIFCSGPTIRINGVPYASPFTIRAVGPTAAMLQRLQHDPDMSGWSQLVHITYRPLRHLAIPSYHLPVQFSFAKPANIGTSRF